VSTPTSHTTPCAASYTHTVGSSQVPAIHLAATTWIANRATVTASVANLYGVMKLS